MHIIAKKSLKLTKSLNGIDPDGAGIEADDRERRKADKERIRLEQLEVLQHFEEGAVDRHEDIMERFHIRLAVLDRYAIAETHALDAVVGKPLRAVGADHQAMIVRSVGRGRERGNLVRAVKDHGIARLDAAADGCFEIRAGDLMVLRKVQRLVDRPAHEIGERQLRNARPVLIVMVRALAVRAEVARQIHDRMEIRDGAAGVEAPEPAAARLRIGIEHLCQVNNVEIAHHILPGRHLLRYSRGASRSPAVLGHVCFSLY